MKSTALFLLLLHLLAGWARAYAQAGDDRKPDPLILTDAQSSYPLGLYLEILEDPGGALTIAEVSSPEFDSRFVPSEVDVPNYGFTDSVYWIRLHLRNEEPMGARWLLEVAYPNMHFVDLYRPSTVDDGFEVTRTGALRPPSAREILHPHIVFDLSVPAQQTLYLRFENGASMTLPLTLWEPAAFFANSFREQIWQSIFLGIMVGLFGYNLFLLISLRDVSYFYLALLLSGIFVYDVSQSSFLDIYIFPDLYFLKQYFITLAVGVLFVSLILFNDSFLSAMRLFPKIHRINIVLAGAWIVLVPMTLFLSYHNLAVIMSPSIVVTLVVAAATVAIAWWRGFRAARFLLIAWAGLLLGILLFILTRMGFIPSNFLTENAYRIGFSWMAVCWSIALADRINLLKAETESANENLRLSERRLTQTMEAMPVGVVVYGPDQRPTFINKRTIEILSNPARGLGPDRSFGRTLAETMSYYSFRIVGSDQSYPLERFAVYQALQGEPSTADDVEADLVDWTVPLEVWASPVLDNDGNVESAVVAFQDITERKRKDAELDEYRRHLERLVMERTEELNTINQQLTDEVAERALLEGLLHKRIAWMSALSLARQKITGTADLPGILEELSESIRQLLDAGYVFILHRDGPGEQVEFRCRPLLPGVVPVIEALMASFQKGSSLRRELELGQTILVPSEDFSSMPAPLQACFQEGDIRSLLLVPLNSGDLVTGLLGLALTVPAHDLTTARTELVMHMTHDLVRLSQEARYLEQSRALVTAEERNRLARDLHDSVTQVLFSANLVAEVLPQIWLRDQEKALQSLEDLRQLTRGALAEMRTMLLELRPAAIAKSPLAELLAQLTEASTSRVQLPFRLFLEQTPALPEEVHIAFYRIAQEALNNVAKHAQAGQVTLSLNIIPLMPEQSGENDIEVIMMVEDDGCGFSPQNEQVEHLGLGIMRERAADIEATLTIDSRIGRGTRVTLSWCSS